MTVTPRGVGGKRYRTVEVLCHQWVKPQVEGRVPTRYEQSENRTSTTPPKRYWASNSRLIALCPVCSSNTNATPYARVRSTATSKPRASTHHERRMISSLRPPQNQDARKLSVGSMKRQKCAVCACEIPVALHHESTPRAAPSTCQDYPCFVSLSTRITLPHPVKTVPGCRKGAERERSSHDAGPSKDTHNTHGSGQWGTGVMAPAPLFAVARKQEPTTTSLAVGCVGLPCPGEVAQSTTWLAYAVVSRPRVCAGHYI